LGFVDRDGTGMRAKKTFQIGCEHGEIGWPFEIEVRPFREGVAGKRALAALSRPRKENGRKRPEKREKTTGRQSRDIFHTLQFSTRSS
jgi:hypothetical protein